MNYVNAFQKIGLTVAAIIFSFAALFYSINPAEAENPDQNNNMGKYMFSTTGFIFNGKPAYNVLVWDTESGKSKIYGLNPTTLKMIQESFQLPASPIY